MKGDRVYFVGNPDALRCEQLRKVILESRDPSVINQAIHSAPDRILGVRFLGDPDQTGAIRRRPGQTLSIRIQGPDQAMHHARLLRAPDLAARLEQPVRQPEDAILPASMGITVDLVETIDRSEGSLLREILDYYLHNESLRVPIEPFHTLLTSLFHRRETDLWVLNRCSSDRILHVDPELLVHEIPPGGKPREPLQRIDPGTGKIQDLGREPPSVTHWKALPDRHPGCLACRQFSICRGWALFEKDSCATWLGLLDGIQEAVRALRDLKTRAGRFPTPAP